MKYILSVDWDYFTLSAEIYWSFINEEEQSYVEAWKKRNISKLSLERYDNFWDTLKKYFVINKNIKMFVSESHLGIYKLLDKDSKLFLFDSHHDCYEDDYIKPKLDCGNWGLRWLLKYRDSSMVWFSCRSADNLNRTKNHWLTRSVSSRVSAFPSEQIDSALGNICKEKVELDFIHVCRSGCWAPPIFDWDFLKFIEISGCNAERLLDQTNVDPFVPRIVTKNFREEYRQASTINTSYVSGKTS